MTLRKLVVPLAILLCASATVAQRPPLRERAAQGDPEAQFTLAKNYEAGRGGLKKDYAEAQRWYRLAAEQGDPFAQASLGLLYRFGKGVPQDYLQAYMWFSLSMAQISGADQDSIAELRGAAAAKMTAEQIEQADRMARQWRPRTAAQQ